MPLFRPRSRFEILRSMAARIVSRSRLSRLERNGSVFHVLAGAASELAEIYFQLARLRTLFSIDSATGSDLDDRAAEIQPATISRRLALFAATQVVFSRTGTAGTVTIPAGTIVSSEDAEGILKFRTVAAGSILSGNTASSPVDVVALEAGTRHNVADNSIVRFVTRVPGVTSVSNPSTVLSGQAREGDREFRARLKSFVQSLTRATPTALEGFATSVVIEDGRRVVFAGVSEPIIPTGSITLYIDDGTGGVEEYSEIYLSSVDVLVSSATGGEVDLFTTARPIRDDAGLVVYLNASAIVRGVDYEINTALGKIEMLTPLSASDSVTVAYRFYTGLIQEVQKVIDGDPTNALAYPGVRGGGVQVIVQAPTTIYQILSAAVSVGDGFDAAEVTSNARAAIQAYINTLSIGESVIAAALVEAVMSVEGMSNFRFISLSGSLPPVDDPIILKNQIARILSAGITLT